MEITRNAINCKVELELNRTKYCVFTAVGADNVDANSNNITFTTKDKKIVYPCCNLLAKDNEAIETS